MARYRCPVCGVRSDNLDTQAEADELLRTHQTYFCPPARPDRRQVAPAVTR